jgi:hypothetical protein
MKLSGIIAESLNVFWGVFLLYETLYPIPIGNYTFLVPCVLVVALIISFLIERRPLLKIRRFKDPRVRESKEIDVLYIVGFFLFSLVIFLIIRPNQEAWLYFVPSFWLVCFLIFIEVGKGLARFEHNRSIKSWE